MEIEILFEKKGTHKALFDKEHGDPNYAQQVNVILFMYIQIIFFKFHSLNFIK